MLVFGFKLFMCLHRRVIVIFILAFFSCQLVMASVADPCALYSETTHSQLQNSIIEGVSGEEDLESITIGLAIQECEHCCHSSGHSHFLSFFSPIPADTVGSKSTLLSSHNVIYQSRSLSPLHRPPIIA